MLHLPGVFLNFADLGLPAILLFTPYFHNFLSDSELTALIYFLVLILALPQYFPCQNSVRVCVQQIQTSAVWHLQHALDPSRDIGPDHVTWLGEL